MMGTWSFRSLLLLPLLFWSVPWTGLRMQTTDPLDGTVWELFAYRRSRPPDWMRFRVEFSDGGLRGFGGCNEFQGSYRINGVRFEILTLEWVDRRECEGPEGVMELESFLFLFFQAGRRIEMETTGERRLLIFRPDGEALTFRPVLFNSLEAA